MKLIKCKACEAEVSPKATSCPKCGHPRPKETSAVTKVVLAIIVLGVIGSFLEDEKPPASASKAAAPAPNPAALAAKEKADAESCKKDLQCWGDKHSIMAATRCQRVVERLAKNSFKWTDKFLEPKFPRFKWKNQKAGVVTYVGDRIQFQNGFGAMVNHIYTCDYDPATEKVLDVNAIPGQLPVQQ